MSGRVETRTDRLVVANMRGHVAALSPARPVEVLCPPDTMTLRPLRASDREAFCAAVGNSREQLLHWVGIFHRVGPAPDARHESLDELFDRQLVLTEIGERTRTSRRRAGVLANGRFVGAFNLNAISRGLEFQAEASWWVATEWMGKGFGAQGVRRLLDAAFAESSAGGIGLHKVLANIQPDNVSGLRVAAKLGFRRVPGVVTNIPVGDVLTRHELYVRSILDE